MQIITAVGVVLTMLTSLGSIIDSISGGAERI